jgi:hypothetical protein
MISRDMSIRFKAIGAVVLAITAAWLCALILASRTIRKNNEIVTVSSGRHIAALSPPAISSSPLPAADSDLEIVGDQIAKAIVHLNRGKRDAALRELDQAQNVSRSAIAKREAALRALNQEQTEQPREPSGRSTTDKVNERLKLALRETEQAKQQIARGKPAVAVAALRKLTRQLDAG